MAPQLQINQGPQDALLFDNTRSYFTNVGYVRTSNFQMELRDVDPQNTANLGSTVNFVIPKAADLLGPVDLLVEFSKVSTAPGTSGADEFWGWVESVGYAMIEKITFSVGSHDVEVLTGEHLNIMNELMRSDSNRYGFHQILKTGRALVRGTTASGSGSGTVSYAGISSNTAADTYDRLIAYDNVIKEGKKLIVPLGLFFTTHPSKYFPLAAIAGCNDVRIAIKFRTKEELLQCHGAPAVHSTGKIEKTATMTDAGLSGIAFEGGSCFKSDGCKLRCHYIHVTGPEATALMNREHVRLMKLWHGNHVQKTFSITCDKDGKANTLDMDLSFLHPVTELVITIRKVADMGSAVANASIAVGEKLLTDNPAETKAYFAYHGGGYNPNPDTLDERVVLGAGTREHGSPSYLTTTSFTLKLNGQSRHLDGEGIDRNYLMNRLMPMLHSSSSTEFKNLADSSVAADKTFHDLQALSALNDRKEIYVFPFALNPEGANPSGSVNFSKVSHAKLSIGVLGHVPRETGSNTKNEEFQVDVYGIYYNWLAIKDGRALTSFA